MYVKIAPADVNNKTILSIYTQDITFQDGKPFMPLFAPRTITIKPHETKIVDLEIVCTVSSSPCAYIPMGYYIGIHEDCEKFPLRLSRGINMFPARFNQNICIQVDNISDAECRIDQGAVLFQMSSPIMNPIKRVITELISKPEKPSLIG